MLAAIAQADASSDLIEVREGTPRKVTLSAREADFMRGRLGHRFVSDGSTITVRRSAGLWALPTGRTLLVRPTKGDGADLLGWMAAVDRRFAGVRWGSLALEGGTSGDVVAIMVRVFCAWLEAELASAGPRRDYQPQHRELSTLRGRIVWNDLARKSLPVRVPCRYWERNLDTPLNRLFAQALNACWTSPVLNAAAPVSLERLRRFFARVPARAPDIMLDLDRPLSRLDAPFEPVRRLAVALILASGHGLGGDERTLEFHVDLARLFERTVEAAVALETWDRPPVPQFRPPYVAGDADGNSRIDVLAVAGGQQLVIDAKYTSAFSKAHLYQVLAYMKMLDASHGALVYPVGAEVPATHFSSLGVAANAWRVELLFVDAQKIATVVGRDELARLGAALRIAGTRS